MTDQASLAPAHCEEGNNGVRNRFFSPAGFLTYHHSGSCSVDTFFSPK